MAQKQSKKMKIAFFEIEPWEKQYIKKNLKGHELLFFREVLNPKHLAQLKDVEIVSPFIYSQLKKGELGKLPKLQYITTRSTGFDHIDVKLLQKKKVPVSNVPFYGENTVAEHTFALILALSRNIHKAYVRSIRGDFSLKNLQGFDLKGKTIGVIGAGHIGLHVIKMAKGFGMHALAFDLHHDTFLSEILRFKYAGLEELLQKSDIISLHAPYNPHTHHLINMENVKLIKKGALLINCGRGGLVDNEALSYALDKGILSGAGLDVLEGEDLLFKGEKHLVARQLSEEKVRLLLENQALLHRENVVITPHLAFDSKEGVQRILDTTIENIKGFLEGKTPHVVG